MNSKDIYILQKELPGMKIGDAIIWHEGCQCYSSENLCYHGQYPMLSQSVIDKYPDFFKKKEKSIEEPIKVEIFQNIYDARLHKTNDRGSYYQYQMCIYGKDISYDKMKEIEQTVQLSLNPSPDTQVVEKESKIPETKVLSNIDAYQMGLKDGLNFAAKNNQYGNNQ
jgi:hypothetical protein